MVGETIMNRCNGSTQSPPSGVAKGMGELTHDIVSLVELQFDLFRVDCREGLISFENKNGLQPPFQKMQVRNYVLL